MDNLQLKQNLTPEQLHLVNSEMAQRQLNPLIAWLLWWFVGILGGHCFYLGQKTKGIWYLVVGLISLITALIFIGFIGLAVLWVLWVIDAFKIQGQIAERNNQIEYEIINRII